MAIWRRQWRRIVLYIGARIKLVLLAGGTPHIQTDIPFHFLSFLHVYFYKYAPFWAVDAENRKTFARFVLARRSPLPLNALPFFPPFFFFSPRLLCYLWCSTEVRDLRACSIVAGWINHCLRRQMVRMKSNRKVNISSETYRSRH